MPTAPRKPWALRSSDMPNTSRVRELLTATTLPPALVDDLLEQASPVWLMGEPAEVLASDLVLCHPPLGPEEVRASVKQMDVPGTWRLSVVAHDRPGLLASVAGALTSAGVTIADASASVWPEMGLALQRVTVLPSQHELADADWEAIGARLRAAVGRQESLAPQFVPTPPVTVEAQPQEGGRVLVSIEAPDTPGLLWAVASWFEQHGCNVEAYRATSTDGRATGTFVVAGDVDCRDLAVAVGGVPAQAMVLPAQAAKAARRIVVAAAGLGTAIALRIWHTVRHPSGS